MDKVKIGRFIVEMRKQQNLAQREFADILGISDKTVSKWECDNGMPELFLGEKLADADYKKKAEENMKTLVKGTENMKKYCRRPSFRLCRYC